MKFLIVTPLYPPDIAGHAQYVKELSTRLSQSHEVTVLTYNHIPEKIDGVRFITIPKKLPSFIRILRCTRALIKAQKKAEVVYFQNGPSVEIPLIIASYFSHTPYVLRLGDETPMLRYAKSFMRRKILEMAIAYSHTIVSFDDSSATKRFVQKIPTDKLVDCSRPRTKPEILPFSTFPQKEMDMYERSWSEHMHTFVNIIAATVI